MTSAIPAKVCPLSKMYTLGSGFIPSANHAGGLRYHGMSSTLSQLYHDGLMEATSVEQTSVFAAAEQFARVEGILLLRKAAMQSELQSMRLSNVKKQAKKNYSLWSYRYRLL